MGDMEIIGFLCLGFIIIFWISFAWECLLLAREDRKKKGGGYQTIMETVQRDMASLCAITNAMMGAPITPPGLNYEEATRIAKDILKGVRLSQADATWYAYNAPLYEPFQRLHGELRYHRHRIPIKGGIPWNKVVILNASINVYSELIKQAKKPSL